METKGSTNYIGHQTNNNLPSEKNMFLKKQLHDSEMKLQELLNELNFQQSEVERKKADYIKQKEKLQTQLAQLKSEAEIENAKIQSDHLQILQKMHSDFSEKIEKLSSLLTDIQFSSNTNSNFSNSYVPQSKSLLSEYEKSSLIYSNNDKSIDINEDKLKKLEKQKTSFQKEIEQQANAKMLMMYDLTNFNNDQNTMYDNEILELQTALQAKENEYQAELLELYNKISEIRDKREKQKIKNQKKISFIQSQIDKLDKDFNQKVDEAEIVMEKLKFSVQSMNAKKEQYLIESRKMIDEFQQLTKENLLLKHKIFELKSNLSTLNKKCSTLRNQCIATYGLRRTQSIFLNLY